jgi:hypothetical protein
MVPLPLLQHVLTFACCFFELPVNLNGSIRANGVEGNHLEQQALPSPAGNRIMDEKGDLSL